MKNPLQIFCIATLHLPALLNAAFEVEPNNTSTTANAIVPDEGMSGQIASVADEDWFGFSVTSTTTVRVTFDSPETNSSSSVAFHTVQLRDQTGAVLASVDTGNDTVFHTTVPAAGSYFVVVRDGPYAILSTGQYTLTVTTQGPLPGAETEPNNTFENANQIATAQIKSGQINSAGDQDWFSFSVAGAGVATIIFDSPESISSSSVVFHTIQVRDADGTLYSSVDTGEDKTFMVGLPAAGKYFVGVKDGPYAILSAKEYSVSVTSTAPPEPSEIQVTIFSAVELSWESSLGKTYVVEWSGDLSIGSWLPLSSSIAGTGTEMGYLDSIRGDSQGFYRVQEH